MYTIEEIDNFLDFFVSKSEKHIIWFLLRPLLKDVNDNLIAELAFASNSEYIITFNKKDFLGVENYGIQVIAPQEFLKILGE
ncbi:MAG: PIN domain-containing protein [Ignavibacteria bacterium]|nr:PIN domain-containing protein [Ignavibacteria bacterium]